MAKVRRKRRKTIGPSLGSQLLAKWRGDRQQVEVAGEVGVAAETYNRFEHGKRKPNLQLATDIEKLTGGEVPATSWYQPPAKTKRVSA